MPITSPLLKPVLGVDWPVYRRDCTAYTMFYAPGYLCVVGRAAADRFQAALGSLSGPASTIPHQEPAPAWALELRRHAAQAQAAVDEWERPFEPECLTLYLSNECNLDCVYCYRAPAAAPAACLEMDAVAAAAELVARHCHDRGLPLYVVLHGGGEPTLHMEQLEQVLELVQRAAQSHDLGLFRYLATNGVISEAKARWVAHHFDLIGLSCDGPPDIQNAQRPRLDGTATAGALERTARILRQEGCPYHVRATITRQTLRQGSEIASYICDRLRPQQIHLEPVYAGGKAASGDTLTPDQGPIWIDQLRAAQQVAAQYGIPLLASGSRPGSIHGPYCNMFRSVLNLVPGGVTTACFKLSTAAQAKARGAVIGAMDPMSGRFEIDHAQIGALRRRLRAWLLECDGCFNQYHCARACPDLCPLEDSPPLTDRACPDSRPWQLSFRCTVHKIMAWTTLKETAERLWAHAQHQENGSSSEYAGSIITGTRIL